MEYNIDISILILTHNAPKYVKKTIKTLNKKTEKSDLKNTEIVVFDNASDKRTKNILQRFKVKNYIQKLFFSEENTLFAKGNNLAATLVSNSSKYLLLLNSDIKIKDSKWLNKLLYAKCTKNYAIASYGYCKNPDRADGFCFLINKDLYLQFLLDENFQWWWSITKLQASILKAGYSILAIKNHNKILYHYGGKSGKDFLHAKGMNIKLQEVTKWFEECAGSVDVIESSFI